MTLLIYCMVTASYVAGALAWWTLSDNTRLSAKIIKAKQDSLEEMRRAIEEEKEWRMSLKKDRDMIVEVYKDYREKYGPPNQPRDSRGRFLSKEA